MKYFIAWVTCVFSLSSYGQGNDTARYLNEIVVSVNRWEQNLKEISNRVIKITPEQIQLQNPQTSADLLSLSNQVFVQKSQLGGGSPMIRGFATNRILLVVDGVRMNNAIFRSGNLQNVISLDPNAIEETEVIFGPGSVIYGSDAIGGVMDFHTLRPEISRDKIVKVTGGSFVRYSSANNERSFHGHVNIGLKKWAFVTSITKGIFDDLKMGSEGPTDYTRPDYQVRENGNDMAVVNSDPNVQRFTGYDQLNLMQKIRFKPSSQWDISYGFHFSETSDVPRYDRLILKNASNFFTSAEWYYGPQKWSMHSLGVRYLKPTIISDQIKLTIGYQQYQESRHSRNFAGSNRNVRTERFEEVDALSINLDLDKQLTEKTTLFYGAEYIDNQIGSSAHRLNVLNGSLSGVSTRYPNGSEWKSAAVYASLRHKVSERWLLNGSTRYSYVSVYTPFDLTYFNFPFTNASVEHGALNGSIGFVYTPHQNWKLYFNTSTGFRAPNVDDLGKVFDSQPGNVIVPNNQLQPETAYNFEMGTSGWLTKNLTIDIAAFYTLLDNAIVRGPFAFNGQSQIDYDGTLSTVLALQNSSEVTVRGIQAGFRWNFHPSWSLHSNVNVQSGKERDVSSGENFSPTHIAPTFGSTQISFQRKKWNVMAYANYNGEINYATLALSERADAHLYAKDENGNPYSPSWATLNLKGTYSISKLISVDGGVENILNKRYRPYSSGISAPGRNFIMSLRVKF